ncbi:MAG TPA: hypothetical protein EYG24_01465 [Methylococcales bacterium]|jgi:hypothetical protein|nr:hypothetical protein [Methylococcales bacterium]
MKLLLKFTLILASFILLVVFTNEGIMPQVYNFISSDAMLVDSDDLGDQIAITDDSDLTRAAHAHCNTLIQEKYGSDHILSMPQQALNIWDIGAHDYVVNGEASLSMDNGASLTKKYVCRIKFDEGSVTDIDNWSLYDISGLDDIEESLSSNNEG